MPMQYPLYSNSLDQSGLNFLTTHPLQYSVRPLYVPLSHIAENPSMLHNFKSSDVVCLIDDKEITNKSIELQRDQRNISIQNIQKEIFENFRIRNRETILQKLDSKKHRIVYEKILKKMSIFIKKNNENLTKKLHENGIESSKIMRSINKIIEYSKVKYTRKNEASLQKIFGKMLYRKNEYLIILDDLLTEILRKKEEKVKITKNKLFMKIVKELKIKIKEITGI